MKRLFLLISLFFIFLSCAEEQDKMVYATGLARYEDPHSPHAAEAYNHSVGKWNIDSIGYFVQDYPKIGSKQGYLDTIQLAFDMWSEHIGKRVYRVENKKQRHNIIVKIEKGDGLGGMLAHAYFPPVNNDDLIMPMVFDYYDISTVEGRGAFDFFQLSCMKRDTILESDTVTNYQLLCTGSTKKRKSYL